MTKKSSCRSPTITSNPFASPDNPKLSPELVDYLSDSAWYHPELCFQMRCPEISENAFSNTFAETTQRGYSHPAADRHTTPKAFSNGKKMTQRHFLRRPHCYAFNTSMDSGITHTTQ
jgi:hypothetical protein